ncbi:GNAT family N-acetyltransferase [Legionella sp. km772]|uniref:GNAT family N-acetyltransferase n=1 Tax=Legionella sp. km772 TaxID=2498111 RepID=UPI000F8C76A2|nr:GNAT family N-acetyltransferase [Legionella sp. km772]RUR10168.1 GNAT family N-acetyltransferase [Legionella sp. km772]
MKTVINKVSSTKELQDCLDIRLEVFVKGQNVAIEEEMDGKDEESIHYLLKVDEQAVGVARVRFIKKDAKIERVAILDSFQNKGLGKQLMGAILADLQQNSQLENARLGSQTHAIPFYEGLGFKVCSEEYMDAGIPHKDMFYSFKAEA